MQNLCIIPARGGSKRIPRKNIRHFLGKPIIAYSIDSALKTGLFDIVMVSTDDSEIADVAMKYGAEVPFMRSTNTSNDYATLADVMKEVFVKYNAIGQSFDNACCLLPTSPLLKPEDIILGYTRLSDSDFTVVVPVVEFSYPILRSFNMSETGEISYNWPEYAKTRSQDLQPAYHDSGTYYWYKVDPWLSGIVKRGAIIVDEKYVQDIDTEHDWKMAEMKYRLLNYEKSLF